MARGWESKAVEAQQDAWADRGSQAGRRSEDPAVAARRATLMLARARALGDLQQACAPAYRAMLEQTIAEIDAQLDALARNA